MRLQSVNLAGIELANNGKGVPGGHRRRPWLSGIYRLMAWDAVNCLVIVKAFSKNASDEQDGDGWLQHVSVACDSRNGGQYNESSGLTVPTLRCQIVDRHCRQSCGDSCAGWYALEP